MRETKVNTHNMQTSTDHWWWLVSIETDEWGETKTTKKSMKVKLQYKTFVHYW